MGTVQQTASGVTVTGLGFKPSKFTIGIYINYSSIGPMILTYDNGTIYGYNKTSWHNDVSSGYAPYVSVTDDGFSFLFSGLNFDTTKVASYMAAE